MIRLSEMRVHEDDLRKHGYTNIAGIDEVGRGPLAGPVYAACVVLPEDFDVTGIYDSKKISPKKREELSAVIRERALACGIGVAGNDEIDEINILEATKNAMKRAVFECREVLKSKGRDIDMLLVDALKLDAGIPCEAIIKGDEKSLSIAAASIVAKVARDSLMTEMDSVYPGYDFASNKGYGTARHYEGLRKLGCTPIHRRTFLKKFTEETERIMEEGVRAYVDGSYDKETGMFSCGVVMVRTDAEGNVTTREMSKAYKDEDFGQQRNIAGELVGSKMAIDFCLSHGIDSVVIYHDYEGIGKWADGEWKAKNSYTRGYRDYVAKARERMKISFVKVAAHTGDKYNELADQLAREALGL